MKTTKELKIWSLRMVLFTILWFIGAESVFFL